jgi:hypothetical protein
MPARRQTDSVAECRITADDGVVEASELPARRRPTPGRIRIPDGCPQSADDRVVEAGKLPARRAPTAPRRPRPTPGRPKQALNGWGSTAAAAASAGSAAAAPSPPRCSALQSASSLPTLQHLKQAPETGAPCRRPAKLAPAKLACRTPAKLALRHLTHAVTAAP